MSEIAWTQTLSDGSLLIVTGDEISAAKTIIVK
jgi:hypothetical protein